HLGRVGGEAARRDHRAARASVLRREPVPSGVPLAAVGAAPALRRLRRGRARTRGSAWVRVQIGGVAIGDGAPLALIGGPCAIENEKHALMTAERLARIAAEQKIGFIYKSSYDKANRSSVKSYRGPGLAEG